jgi:hypothetical protein
MHCRSRCCFKYRRNHHNYAARRNITSLVIPAIHFCRFCEQPCTNFAQMTFAVKRLFRSSQLSVKSTFQANKLSVKCNFRSNDHFGQTLFGQRYFGKMTQTFYFNYKFNKRKYNLICKSDCMQSRTLFIYLFIGCQRTYFLYSCYGRWVDFLDFVLYGVKHRETRSRKKVSI